MHTCVCVHTYTHTYTHTSWNSLLIFMFNQKLEIMPCYACRFSCFSHVYLFATLQPVAHQASLSMGFPRQANWSGLWFPSSGDLPNPRMELASLTSPALAGRFFTTSSTKSNSIFYNPPQFSNFTFWLSPRHSKLQWVGSHFLLNSPSFSWSLRLFLMVLITWGSFMHSLFQKGPVSLHFSKISPDICSHNGFSLFLL